MSKTASNGSWSRECVDSPELNRQPLARRVAGTVQSANVRGSDAITMVDVKNGKITEVLKPDKDEPIGNLVVHRDFLISQTLTEIVVFPIRK